MLPFFSFINVQKIKILESLVKGNDPRLDYVLRSEIVFLHYVVFCVPEPQSQDSRGGPEDEDQAMEEQAPVHSGVDKEDEGDEENEQWTGPG